MSSLIFIIFSVVAFLGLWLLGKNTGIKLHRHWTSYLFSLLIVSLPLLIISTVFGLNNLFMLSGTGKIFGLPISMLVMLIVMPFAGIYLWGLSKRLISDKPMLRLLPPIIFGLVLAFSVYLLINFNSSFSRIAAVISIVSILILSISKLSYLRRFWVFELLIGLLLLAINLITTPFGYTLNNESIWGFKLGLITIEWFMIYFAFMNIFLAVFYWLDNKIGLILKNQQSEAEDLTSKKDHEMGTSGPASETTENKNLDQLDARTQKKEKLSESNFTTELDASLRGQSRTSETLNLVKDSSNGTNDHIITENIDGQIPSLRSDLGIQNQSLSLNTPGQVSLSSSNGQHLSQKNPNQIAAEFQGSTTRESAQLQNEVQSGVNQTGLNSKQSNKITERSFNLRSTSDKKQTDTQSQKTEDLTNITTSNQQSNSTKLRSIIPKVDVKSRLEKLYAARALARKASEATNPDFKMPNFSNMPDPEIGLNLKDKRLEDSKMPEPISLKLDTNSQNATDIKPTVQNSQKDKTKKENNQKITLDTSKGSNRVNKEIGLNNFSRKSKLTNFKMKVNKNGKLGVYSPEADTRSRAMYESLAGNNVPNDSTSETNKQKTMSAQDRLNQVLRPLE